MADTVLVTGVSGFLGGHVALELLRAGYRVRGSVRDLKKSEVVRDTMRRAGGDIARLQLIALDLISDAGWTEAAQGCRFVQHTASPFVLRGPKDKNELIRPAVEGTRRALEAGFAAGAERIVVTSSMAAIAYGHGPHPAPFTESDWTDPDGPGVNAYVESKTRAEREAWRIADAHGTRDKLSTINPSVILGPFLDSDPGTSGQIIVAMLKGLMPAVPNLRLGVVDVRDVAAMHLAAMTLPQAAGQRHIASVGTLSLMEMGQAIGAAIPQKASRMPRFTLPDWLVRGVALAVPALRGNVAELGADRQASSERARLLLGRPLITAREAAVASAQTALAQGIVR